MNTSSGAADTTSMPWVVGGDFNAEPQTARADIHHLGRRAVVVSLPDGEATYFGGDGAFSSLGYYLAHPAIALALGVPAAVQLPLSPHTPVSVVTHGVSQGIWMGVFGSQCR